MRSENNFFFTFMRTGGNPDESLIAQFLRAALRFFAADQRANSISNLILPVTIMRSLGAPNAIKRSHPLVHVLQSYQYFATFRALMVQFGDIPSRFF